MPFAVRSLVLAACPLVLAGCAALTTPDMRMGAGPPRAVVAATPFNAVERDFVTKVATRNVYEIEVSRLAAERALSPAVRDYAQRLVHQQTQMNDELVALMSAHGVAPPKGLPADKATKLHRLAALPRSDAFDNGYIRVVGIEDHRAAIASFEKAARLDRPVAHDPAHAPDERAGRAVHAGRLIARAAAQGASYRSPLRGPTNSSTAAPQSGPWAVHERGPRHMQAKEQSMASRSSSSSKSSSSKAGRSSMSRSEAGSSGAKASNQNSAAQSERARGNTNRRGSSSSSKDSKSSGRSR